MQRGIHRKTILSNMSPQLQGEVALAINRRWIEGIRFLHGAETELVVLVACSLQPAVFTPGELATPGHLYVVHKVRLSRPPRLASRLTSPLLPSPLFHSPLPLPSSSLPSPPPHLPLPRATRKSSHQRALRFTAAAYSHTARAGART